MIGSELGQRHLAANELEQVLSHLVELFDRAGLQVNTLDKILADEVIDPGGLFLFLHTRSDQPHPRGRTDPKTG